MTAPLSCSVLNAKAVSSVFCTEVISGLSSTQKTIPARWLYDFTGSELFEEITQLPEYYPTRTERSILERCANELANLIDPRHVVVEFGAGSASKTTILLNAINPAAYVPIDISGEFLYGSAQSLTKLFPALPISPVIGDFTKPLQLPSTTLPRLGFFPGSTIGNLIAPVAVDLLRAMAATLGKSAKLLIGIDRIKSPEILLPAYNDAQGVTAKFNLNLLHRINRELIGTIPAGSFTHVAIWNDHESRIEMHLKAEQDISFDVAGTAFKMSVGETIHTENSIKYGTREMRFLLRSGGWTPLKEWTDDECMFSVLLAETSGQATVP